ncbi:hypothetical protein [Hyalangium versicolor]|uniref:hypothetical protein n=1 Tax=Hyalangium versicolor TaxID=2861190 RepID=UPI001CCF3987|nr:hypothetical protein [Hyalangium versicolor]
MPKRSSSAPANLPRGKTSLGDFRERFMARAAELAAREDVRVLWNHVGEPSTREKVKQVAEKAGVQLSEAEIEFYARSNGLALVWVPVHAPGFDSKVHKSKKGIPTLREVESLDTDSFRMIVMPPIERVVEPIIDYSRDLDGDVGRLFGVDFPGQYTTPALVVLKGKPTVVKVGDDYGADWTSSRASSLEDYVETLLATWGDVSWRRTLYIRREHEVGRAYFEAKPVPLESLLPPVPTSSAKEELALLRTLRRERLGKLSDELLAKAARALFSKNEELLRCAAQCLRDDRVRSVPHVKTVVAALEKRATDLTWDRRSVDAFRPDELTSIVDLIHVPLELQDAEVVLRHGGSYWGARARAARDSGGALLETLAALLDGDVYDKFSAVGAAILLGPAVAPLRRRLEALFSIEETYFDLELSDAAAMAVVSIDPSRAGRRKKAVRTAMKSELWRYLWHEDDETPTCAPLFSRLPEDTQAQLAHHIAEVKVSSSHVAQLELLMALGRAGIETAFQLVEKYADEEEESDGGYFKRFLLCIVLPRCELTREERRGLVARVKRELVAEKKRTGFWHDEYLVALLTLGGLKSLPSDVRPKDLKALDPERFYAERKPLQRALLAFRASA